MYRFEVGLPIANASNSSVSAGDDAPVTQKKSASGNLPLTPPRIGINHSLGELIMLYRQFAMALSVLVAVSVAGTTKAQDRAAMESWACNYVEGKGYGLSLIHI